MIATMLHHIRRSILDMLATTESLRYSELKPKSLDGNVFNYHLKVLIVDKLVKKGEHGDYSLSQAGRNYIVHRYEDSILSTHSIFLIVLKRRSEYLLRRREIQPLIGYAGFIHGEPEIGVDVVHTAKERLCAKTGIKNVSLSVVGSALITQYRAEELQSFSHAIIIYGQTQDDIKIESDATGSNFWANLEIAKNLLPSCIDIVKMIDNQQTWLEKSYQID